MFGITEFTYRKGVKSAETSEFFQRFGKILMFYILEGSYFWLTFFV